jgi:hypothetical protein
MKVMQGVYLSCELNNRKYKHTYVFTYLYTYKYIYIKLYVTILSRAFLVIS